MCVVNNYNIRIEPRFLTEPNSFRTESEFFQTPNQNQTEIKNLFRTSLSDTTCFIQMNVQVTILLCIS